MPLTKKGKSIIRDLTERHGSKEGKTIFYKMVNSGKHPGLEKGK